MKPKHLLTIFMLLFVGAISAFSLTSSSPEINTPVGNEEPTKPDKTGLTTAITEAERLAEADYTPTSWSALQTALTAAKTVNKDENATQDAVNNATSTLQSAITNLIKKADKTELQSVITAANLTEGDYTPGSWKVLKEALDAANTINENRDATQDAVNSAANTLQTAIDKLIEKADKTALKAIINKTTTENNGENKDFWTPATNALNAANTINENEEASQQQVDDATLALQKAFNTAPFNYAKDNYQAKYVEYYGKWNEGDATYMEVFNESDFGGLKMMIDSISTLYKNRENEIPENEIYGEEDTEDEGKTDPSTGKPTVIPGKRGIIRQYKECIAKLPTTLTNKKDALKALVDNIAEGYSELQLKETYKTASTWYTQSPFPVKLTAIILYTGYLKEEISFIDLKQIYLNSIDEAKVSIKVYFTEDEQVDSNEAWKKASAPFDAFKDKLNNISIDPIKSQFIFDGTIYLSLEEMQKVTNSKQEEVQGTVKTLRDKLTTDKETLDKNIQTARTLLSLLITGVEQRTALNTAIEEAEKGKETTILSTVEKANTSLLEADNKGNQYYSELKSKLQSQIGIANDIEDKSSFQSELINASTIYSKEDATDTEIINATNTLKDKIGFAAKRDELKKKTEALTTCKDTYGDEDESIEALITEAKGTVQDNEIEALIKKIEQKIETTEESYQSIQSKLEELIEACKVFIESYPEKDRIDDLKAGVEAAKKLDTKVIKTLTDTYNKLNLLYKEIGGDAESYLSRKELENTILQAETYYKKYNYSDLLTLINTAKNVAEKEEAKYALEQQTQALKKGMTTTLEQYKLIIIRLDEQIISTQTKVTERYDTKIPKSYQEILTAVSDSLMTVDESEERACTNVSLLQEYLISLLDMIKESDDAWNTAVSNLWDAIQDADLKYQADYTDKQDLGIAISVAKEKYQTIDKYPTIAAIKQIAKDLDTVLSGIESSLRQNLALLFTNRYSDINKSLQIYGSDDKSSDTSNAQLFINEKKELNEELLSSGTIISYTLPQLTIFADSAKLVQDTYTLFCNASMNLGETIGTAQHVNKSYYNDKEGTALHIGIQNAILAKNDSHSKEIIETNNIALKDSMRVTALIYNEALRNMKIARNTAQTKHTIYYGSKVETSKILEVYNEAEALLTDSLISDLEAMTAKLNECYKEAESTSAEKEAKIQALIALSDSLNLQMEDDKFDEEIAGAINAKYCNDGRIDSIDTHLVKLQGMYDKQLNKYETACTALSDKLTDAKELLAIHTDKNLSDTIALAEKMLEKAGIVIAKNKAKYKELIDATEWLTEIMAIINKQIETELVDARETLVQARAEALAKHNLFYGAANTDSIAILKVYNEAEAFLASNNLADLILMTDSVNQSYVQPAVDCSQKEAGLDNLIRKSTPLVTLMDNTELAKIIIKARECRNRMDGRIVAIDSVRPSLQEAYEADCIKYDKAAYELSDSIDVAKELLEIKKDEALQNAVTVAEAVLDAADKTSASSTKYTELVMQTPLLVKEMQRVRILIKEAETGIYVPSAENREVEIYTTQGFLVKRVRLSDSNPFQSIPEGVYIVDGKKIYIHVK